jgi:2-polyprenyl-3-methyl-5-hydroxy-6-metoxy-1,4-benzoquinol methylase
MPIMLHFVPVLGQPVLDLLQPQSGGRILDLGCGNGVLTEKLVALGAQVVGIDNSPDMALQLSNRDDPSMTVRRFRFLQADLAFGLALA